MEGNPSIVYSSEIENRPVDTELAGSLLSAWPYLVERLLPLLL